MYNEAFFVFLMKILDIQKNDRNSNLTLFFGNLFHTSIRGVFFLNIKKLIHQDVFFLKKYIELNNYCVL